MHRFLLLFTLLCAHLAHAEAPVHHHLEVTLEPERNALRVVDTVTLSEGMEREFLLHRGLAPKLEGPGRLLRLGTVEGAVPLEHFRVEGVGTTFTLRYGGEIRHALRAWSGRRGKVEHATPAEIGPEGVYLSGAGGWYPLFGDRLVSFELSVTLPDGWRSVSQGEEPEENRWRETRPQDDLYLLAYPYRLHRAPGPHGEARVYLRGDDDALAQRYLSATTDYLALYSRLIGPYPYAKFALVENRWESGYGMPSFTLLGPRVLRLPFILHTSYPHEILHNWWGNGVYIDFSRGNWAEGLTAYLADHLLKERRGRGADYRRDQLRKYTEHVKRGDDAPLRQFRSRHGEASQAVGYGKSAQLFHMLRRAIGDEAFIDGLRRFYREQRFQRASFDELAAAFEGVPEGFFDQWLERAGAPALEIVEARADGNALALTLRQGQPGAPYRLEIPLALRLAGHESPYETTLAMDQREQSWRLTLPAAPLRLELDPRFDLFRRLDPAELPVTLDRLFGAERLLIVYAEKGPKALRRIAASWAEGDETVTVKSDRQLEQLPEEGAVWLMGWENRLLPELKRRLPDSARLDDDALLLNGKRWARDDHALVLTAAEGPGPTLAWLGLHRTDAAPGLARKLPHYGKRSHLAFSGEAPTVVLKGEWPVTRSPTARVLADGGEAALRLAPHPPLERALE